MEILNRDLPDVTKARLQAALSNPPAGTFVISESRQKWAWTGLAISVLGIWSLIQAADQYKWHSSEEIPLLAFSIVTIAIASYSLNYLVSWSKSEFKPSALVNPLYFIRFRSNTVEVIPFTGKKIWTFRHLKDANGRYGGTKFYFQPEFGPRRILKVVSARAAGDLIAAMEYFAEYVTQLVEIQDRNTLYFYDLLFEWRLLDEKFPRGPHNEPTGFAFLRRKFTPFLIATLIAIMTFVFGLTPYNDFRDDELRWVNAKSVMNVSGYRVYIASRPDGRHVAEAHSGIDALYEQAATRYRDSADDPTSQGVDIVVKMLEYAKRTEKYQVFVSFEADNQIPNDIESRIQSVTGLRRIVPILPSFTREMDRGRETRILQKISESFGERIPGDILQFSMGEGRSDQLRFVVRYLIRATGEIYYPVSQEKLNISTRDWYTGIGFDWGFLVAVPDANSSHYQFAVKSQPAQLFHVAYSRNSSEQNSLEPTIVYSAMADSAFENFGSNLLVELAVKPNSH